MEYRLIGDSDIVVYLSLTTKSILIVFQIRILYLQKKGLKKI